MKTKKIETRKDEIRFSTTDPKRMLDKFLVNKVLRKWMEDFVDKTTGQIVSIERSETVFDAGVLLTKDKIQRIVFHQQAGDITEPIEVSNQNRKAHPIGMPTNIWTLKARVDGRGLTFMCKANSISHAQEATADYIELNYSGMYAFTQIKLYDRVIYLEDTFVKDKNENEEEDTEEQKYYRISASVEIDNEKEEINEEFLVKASTAERALMVINHYLAQYERDKATKEHKSPRNVCAFIEESKIISVTATIPEEFTIAHKV